MDENIVFDLMNGTEQVRSVFVKLSRGPENNVSGKAFTKFFKGMGSMFYLMDNKEVSYENPDQVPDFIRDATPYFLIFMLIENIILWIEKKPLMRLNDGVTSAALGMIQRCGQ
nr:alkylglycerol monooxygenase-like [Onthophagus taurus]